MLVNLKAEVTHEHLVEEFGEERHLKGVFLVVFGSVVEEDAERHRSAVELAALRSRRRMHEYGRCCRKCVASLANHTLALFASLSVFLLPMHSNVRQSYESAVK